MKIISIKKLYTKKRVYDLHVPVTNNFYIETGILTSNCDSMSPEAQRCLRNIMEEYHEITRFVLTANYLHKIIEPLRSRCVSFPFIVEPEQYQKKVLEILSKEKIEVPPGTEIKLVKFVNDRFPDLRKVLNDLQKCCNTGSLVLSSNDNTKSFATVLFTELLKKTSPLKLRKVVIESEQQFGGNYQNLLKELMEACFVSKVEESKKKQMILQIGEHLYRDAFVVDHEINFFCCLVSVNENL